MKRKCDFCGKTKEENNIDFFVSRGSVICSECVEKCWTLKNKKIKTVNQETQTDRMRLTPKKIMSYLNEYIVGQEEAKKTLSVAVYNHLKTMNNPNIKKSNVLVLGPTGSGKTYLAETLSHIVNLPFAIADATTLTEAGYVGDDVHSILLKLIHAANNDIKQAEKGIVYIDEIDKIAKKGEGRDISGEGVQQALLKMMEGCLVTIPGDKERKTIMINFHTANLRPTKSLGVREPRVWLSETKRKTPECSGVSFFRAGNSNSLTNAFHICVYVHLCVVPRYIASQHPWKQSQSLLQNTKETTAGHFRRSVFLLSGRIPGVHELLWKAASLSCGRYR